MIQYDLAPKSEVYIATGTATEFNCGFYVGDVKDVYVEIDGSSVAAAGNYDVIKDSGGMGRVVFSSAVTSGAKVQMFRLTPMTQGVDLKQGEAFYPEQVESAFDKLTMIVQEIRGGTVHAGGTVDSAAYAGRAGTADTADYLNEPDRSALIGSATAAVGGGIQTTIVDYIARQGTVPYASSAGGLTPSAKADIISSAGGGGDGGVVVPDYGNRWALNVSHQTPQETILTFQYTNNPDDEHGYELIDDNGLGGTIIGNVFFGNFSGVVHELHVMLGTDLENAISVFTISDVQYNQETKVNVPLCVPIPPNTSFEIVAPYGGLMPLGDGYYYVPNVRQSEPGPGPGPTPPTPSVPEAPVPYAIPTSATSGTVTVYADYSSDSIQKQAQIESAGWTVYPAGGVVVSSNCTVYFRGGNDTGYSEVASYAVSNIDKTPPALELDYDNKSPNLAYDRITASTEAGATIQYRAPGASTWMTYTEPVNVYDNGTWTFKATDAAGNTTTTTITYNNILSGHETPGDDSGDPVD